MDYLEELQILLLFPKDNAEYKNAASKLKGATDVDTDTRKCLERFELETPLDQDQISQIPNIYMLAPNSYKFLLLTELLNHFSDSRNIRDKILAHFQQLLEQKEKPPLYLQQIAISVLLRYYMGVDGTFLLPANKKQNIKNDIKKLLCSNKDNDSQVDPVLYTALISLKHLLRNPADINSRLCARDICESLQILLDLPQMLSLNIDGITGVTINENLCLIIGVTGSGKSTLINYLTGIEHDCIEDSNTGKIYLHPKPGQKNVPAKVGHSVKSQTLYPQIISDSEFSYCDCPGFDDNRTNEQAVCAALGVPLAVKNAKHIRSIVIVIDWETTNPTASGRGLNFRLLTHTLNRLFGKALTQQLQGSSEKVLPLIFAITKPPAPRRQMIFNTDKLRRQFIGRISEIQKARQDVFAQIAEEKNHIQKLYYDLKVLKICIDELKTINYSKDLPSGGLGYYLTKTIARVTGEADVVERGRIERSIEEQSDKWKKDNLPEEALAKLVNLLRKISRMNEEHKIMNEISLHMIEWQNAVDKLQRSIKDIEKKVEESEGEKIILELIQQSADRIFIIRGYKDNDRDEDDHKAVLLQCIRNFRDTNLEIKSNQLVFDPAGKEFEGVRNWADESALDVNFKLKNLLLLPELIKSNEKRIDMKREEISKEQKELDSELKSDQNIDAENTEKAKKVKLGIDIKKKQIKNAEESISRFRSKMKALQKQNESIERATEIEYGSRMCFETRNALGRSFGVQTDWNYSFPGGYYYEGRLLEWLGIVKKKHIIPIHRVELSSLVNAKGEILFKSPLNENILEGDNFKERIECNPRIKVKRLISTIDNIMQIEAEGYKKTGKFYIDLAELEEGRLIIRYYSNGGEDGQAAIRVFILPKNLPENVKKIQDNNTEIKRYDTSIAECYKDKCETEEKLKEDEVYLGLLNSGLGKDQKTKLDRIILLLDRLGYDLQHFIGKFFPEVKSDLEWLLDVNNLKHLENLLAFKDEDFRDELKSEIKIDEKIITSLLGFPSSNQTTLYESLEHALAEIPKYFIERMFKVCQKSGLTIYSLHKLLNSLKEVSSQSRSLLKELNILELERDLEKYCFEKLIKFYQSTSLMLRTLNIITSLLDFHGNSNINEFSNHYTEILNPDFIGIITKFHSCLTEEAQQAVFQRLREYYHYNTQVYGLPQSILLSKENGKNYEITIEDLKLFYQQAIKDENRDLRYIKREKGLIGRMPDNSIKEFEEFEALGDGACGFHVLGISRKELVELLLPLANKEAIRNEVSLEILNALKTNDLQEASTERSKELYVLYCQVRDELPELEKTVNALIKQIEPECSYVGGIDKLIVHLKANLNKSKEYEGMLNKLETYLKEVQACEQEMSKYCCSEEIYVRYVTSLGKTGWIGHKSAKLVAKLKHINLYIWTKNNNTELLELTDSHIEEGIRPIIHMLYKPSPGHFDLLAEKVDDDFILMQESPRRADEKISVANNKSTLFGQSKTTSSISAPPAINLDKAPQETIKDLFLHKDVEQTPNNNTVTITFTNLEQAKQLQSALHKIGIRNIAMPEEARKIEIVQVSGVVRFTITLSLHEYNAIMGENAFEKLVSEYSNKHSPSFSADTLSPTM